MPSLPTCRWCGGAPHAGEACPLVASIEYEHEDGKPRVIRVEFHPPQSGLGLTPINCETRTPYPGGRTKVETWREGKCVEFRWEDS